MAVPVDPGAGLQDNVDTVLLAGSTGLHQRFLKLYTVLSGGVDADNMDLTANFAWTGDHTFSGTTTIPTAGTFELTRDDNTSEEAFIDFVDSSAIKWSFGLDDDSTNDLFILHDGAEKLFKFHDPVTSATFEIGDGTTYNARLNLNRPANTDDARIQFRTGGTNKWYVGLADDSTDHLWFESSTGKVFRVGDSATTAAINMNEGNELDDCRFTLDRSTTSDEAEIQWRTGGTTQWELGLNISGSDDLALTENGTTRWRIEEGTGDLLLRDTDPPTANYANRNGIVKAWAELSSAGSLQDSYNVSSASRVSTGVFQFVWDTDFSSTNYCLIGTPGTSNDASIAVTVQNTGNATFRTYNQAGTLTNTTVYCVAIGDQ